MSESIENSRDTSPLDASARITSLLSEPKNIDEGGEIKNQVIDQLLLEIQQDSETLAIIAKQLENKFLFEPERTRSIAKLLIDRLEHWVIAIEDEGDSDHHRAPQIKGFLEFLKSL
jgi:hypothetical protein